MYSFVFFLMKLEFSAIDHLQDPEQLSDSALHAVHFHFQLYTLVY